MSLCQTDIIRGAVQVVQEGGDNNLHSHTGMDGFWMVLKGAVRFYGPGDEVLGEFGCTKVSSRHATRNTGLLRRRGPRTLQVVALTALRTSAST